MIPRRLGNKAKIVSLRATHRVAPTTFDVKGIVSATFTTPITSRFDVGAVAARKAGCPRRRAL